MSNIRKRYCRTTTGHIYDKMPECNPYHYVYTTADHLLLRRKSWESYGGEILGKVEKQSNDILQLVKTGDLIKTGDNIVEVKGIKPEGFKLVLGLFTGYNDVTEIYTQIGTTYVCQAAKHKQTGQWIVSYKG